VNALAKGGRKTMLAPRAAAPPNARAASKGVVTCVMDVE